MKRAKKSQRNDSVYHNNTGVAMKALVIGGIVLLAIVGLVLFAVSRTDTQVPTAGKAISGLGAQQTVSYAGVSAGQLVINPAKATAAMHQDLAIKALVGEEFTFDVIGNIGGVPAGSKFNNYQLTVVYDPLLFSFMEAKNQVPGSWTFSVLENKPGIVTVRGDGTSPFADVYKAGEVVPFVEIKLKPLKVATIATSVGPKGFAAVHTYTTTGDLITAYTPGQFLIYVRYYGDSDGDGWGVADLSKSILGDGSKIPLGYQSIFGDCDDNRNNVYPGAPEKCDNIDNNCQDGTSDEVLPTCESLGAACGIHRVCENTRFLDCNLGTVGQFLTGAQKCGEGKICSDKQCVTPTRPIPNLATPACGDGVCQYFENRKTCPSDCTTCPTGVDCAGGDTDRDGLSDTYETYLDGQMVAKAFPAGTFSAASVDSDGDEVNDGEDQCPGTNAPGVALEAKLTVSNGKASLNGCPVGDVTKEAGLGADGCFTLKDTTVMLQYYFGRESCPANLFR